MYFMISYFLDEIKINKHKASQDDTKVLLRINISALDLLTNQTQRSFVWNFSLLKQNYNFVKYYYSLVWIQREENVNQY